MIIGWDTASKLTGWCAGDGTKIPTAGAFLCKRREVPSELGVDFKNHVLAVHREFPADRWYVEEPIVTKIDQTWKVQRLVGVWFLLNTLAGSLGIECESIDQDLVKREWGGRAGRIPGETSDQRRRRHKLLAVEMAEKMGITLPATEAGGKFDAADASGVWKCGLRKSRSSNWQRWDMVVHGHRGALL